jgi:hypothetical protein
MREGWSWPACVGQRPHFADYIVGSDLKRRVDPRQPSRGFGSRFGSEDVGQALSGRCHNRSRSKAAKASETQTAGARNSILGSGASVE